MVGLSRSLIFHFLSARPLRSSWEISDISKPVLQAGEDQVSMVIVVPAGGFVAVVEETVFQRRTHGFADLPRDGRRDAMLLGAGAVGLAESGVVHVIVGV